MSTWLELDLGTPEGSSSGDVSVPQGIMKMCHQVPVATSLAGGGSDILKHTPCRAGQTVQRPTSYLPCSQELPGFKGLRGLSVACPQWDRAVETCRRDRDVRVRTLMTMRMCELQAGAGAEQRPDPAALSWQTETQPPNPASYMARGGAAARVTLDHPVFQ